MIQHSPVSAILWFAGFAGAAYAVIHQRYVIPSLLGITVLFKGTHPRFVMPVAALGVGFLIVQGGMDLFKEYRVSKETASSVLSVVAAAVILVAAFSGAAYAETLPGSDFGDNDRAAMEWMESNTPANASVIVMRGPEEEMPLYGDRTTIVMPWGAEWEGTFNHHKRMLRAFDSCETPKCVSATIAKYNLNPDYLYISKPIGGASSFRKSANFTLVHQEGDNVFIYRVQINKIDENN